MPLHTDRHMSPREAEKPEYTCQVVLYFHAKDDEEATSRAGALRHAIEDMLGEEEQISRWTYEEVESGDLGQREHLGRPARKVN